MLHPRLNALRRRLDALREGRVLAAGLVERALARVAAGQDAHRLPVLDELHRELDRAGIHTAADAKLLKELGVRRGQASALVSGLRARAEEALEEYARCLRRIERRLLAGREAGGTAALERDFVRLARAAKVADIFAADGTQRLEFEVFEGPAPLPRPAPASARFALAEFLFERARRNVEDVLLKRRDLDAAHELLLRLGNDMERDRSRALRIEVAAARERVRAAPVVRSVDQLVRHVRQAARRDPSVAYRSLKGLYERAIEANDAGLAAAARAALGAMLPPASELRRASDRVVLEGGGVTRREPDGPALVDRRPKGQGEQLAELAFDLDDTRLSALELAAGCARYFDVEDALAEEVVETDASVTRPVPRRVSHPTQAMTFEVTHRLDELSNFVISDPRRLVYDLASGRQLVRAYLEEEPPARPRKVRRSAVRVYVLDASGSMHGPRARFRDAILMAELQSLRVKARAGVAFDPLYFSFFNDTPTDLIRVDSAQAATRHLEALFQSSPAHGQTDIWLALQSAFGAIRSARGQDRYLARATVVLVTDGEDAVDVTLLRRSKAPVDDVDIALSFISLGEENPDLKAVVLEQRARGGRAFYHHLSDAEIASARTEFDSAWRTLLPADVEVTAAALDALGPHLEALEALARGRPVTAPARPEGAFDARFPESPAPAQEALSVSEEELLRLRDIVAAVAEAVSLAPADARAAEAVALLDHLLALYDVPLRRYLAGLARRDAALLEPVARVRLLARPFG